MKIKIGYIKILLVFLVIISFSCSKKNSSNNNTPTVPVVSNTVSIVNMSFSASAISVNKNTTVTWTNNDTAPHTVTADDNSFTSPTLNKGDTFSHAFDAVGTVNYHCKIHSGMTGSVTVK